MRGSTTRTLEVGEGAHSDTCFCTSLDEQTPEAGFRGTRTQQSVGGSERTRARVSHMRKQRGKRPRPSRTLQNRLGCSPHLLAGRHVCHPTHHRDMSFVHNQLRTHPHPERSPPCAPWGRGKVRQQPASGARAGVPGAGSAHHSEKKSEPVDQSSDRNFSNPNLPANQNSPLSPLGWARASAGQGEQQADGGGGVKGSKVEHRYQRPSQVVGQEQACSRLHVVQVSRIGSGSMIPGSWVRCAAKRG